VKAVFITIFMIMWRWIKTTWAHGKIAIFIEWEHCNNSKLFSYTQITLAMVFHFISLWWKWSNGLNGAQELNLLQTIHAACDCARKNSRVGNGDCQDHISSTECSSSKRKQHTYRACSPGAIWCDECNTCSNFEAEITCYKPILNSVSGKTTQTTPVQQLFSP
jgi:hypothetical protein